MLLIALVVMMVVVTSHHLDFPIQALKVASKIAKCPKCLSFWMTLCVLMADHCNPLIAIGLSFLMAYLSYWLGLLLSLLSKIYDKLWQRLNSK